MTLYAASAEPHYLSQEQAIIQSKTQFALNADYLEYMGCKSSTDAKWFGSKLKFSESGWPFPSPELSACSHSMDNFSRHFKNESVETETVLKFYSKPPCFQQLRLFYHVGFCVVLSYKLGGHNRDSVGRGWVDRFP